MNQIIQNITNQIIQRSKPSRDTYLQRMKGAKKQITKLSCSNIAHAISYMSKEEKQSIQNHNMNLGIITAYNDMLSAHEPYKHYPALIKKTLEPLKATAQVASGVPAMCDGVTQGQAGMELSLFSRDTIALSSSIGLSHNIFDGVIFLGVCDKIVPGLLMSGFSFGYLPSIFIPSGPMPSGISNDKKSKIRQEYAQGKIDSAKLLETESASYHSCGTCTFYGTANSNQMLLEMLGLQLPNSSFVNANTPLRDKLTSFATQQLHTLVKENITLCDIVDEKSFVNAIIGLMATGGSTNHTIHLIAMAKMAGIILKWEDFDAISKVTPLLCKLYPNGSGDVNHFRDAGGMAVVLKQLLELDLIHNDVQTIMGKGLDSFIVEPILEDQKLCFKKVDGKSKNLKIIAHSNNPFDKEGGVKLLQGNIGQAVTKISALQKDKLYIKAPAIVFHSQEELQEKYQNNQLNKDFIAVVPYQGPQANGMPELHGLLPALGSLQDLGYKVALLTDGRMSGASGKVPSAIHITPEAKDGGVIGKIKDGDIIILDIKNGVLEIKEDINTIQSRKIKTPSLISNNYGSGREMFGLIRNNISSANLGATIFELPGEEKS